MLLGGLRSSSPASDFSLSWVIVMKNREAGGIGVFVVVFYIFVFEYMWGGVEF